MSLIDLIVKVLNFIIKSLVLLLKVQNSGFDWCAFSSFVFELPSDLFQLFTLEIAISSHLFDDSFKFLSFSFEFFGLLLIFLDVALLWLSLLSEFFILLFHFSELFVSVLFFCHCLSSFSFHFCLESLHFFLGQITFSLKSHVILVVFTGFSDFVFKFDFKVSDSFFVQHGFSSLLFQSFFEVSDVAVSSEELFLSGSELIFFTVQNLFIFSDLVLIDSRFSSLIFQLIFQKVDLIFGKLDLFSCFIKLVLLSVGLFNFSFQLTFKLSDGSFVN